MSKYSEVYLKYLESSHWSELRNAALNKANRKCEACMRIGKLHGHHLVYREPLELCTTEDIMALCEPCHNEWHKWLAQQRRRATEFDRSATRGGIIVLVSTIPKSKPEHEYPPKKDNPSIEIRENMKRDPVFMGMVRTLDRKKFKRAMRRRFTDRKNRGRMLANANIVYQGFHRSSNG